MFQSFEANSRQSAQQESPAAAPAYQVRELVSRYPNLSETELARLINLYRNLSALDTALMLSDEGLAPRLDRFSREHRSMVRPAFRQYAGLLAYALLTIGAVIWAVIVAST